MSYQTFHRSAESIVTLFGQSDASFAALSNLEASLEERRSILVSQDPDFPIRAAPACATSRPPRQMLFCQSSGSSGAPKVIRRDPVSWIRSFDVNRDRFTLRQGDSYAVLGAMSHSLTLYAMLEALHIGADLLVLHGASPRAQLKQLQAHQTTVLYATPSQLRLLLEGMGSETSLLPHLRLVMSGGGKLDGRCRMGMDSLCPQAQILEFYGASETSFISLADAQTPEASVGHPYPDVEMRIVNASGQPTHGVGEIFVKSPYLFDGYEEGDSPHTRWREGFLSVGEMGFVDRNGNLFLKGRKSRMVTVADQNVFLEDVEAVLLADEAIPLAAVLAQKDDLRGHKVVAFVEAEPSEALAQRLKSACRAVLGALSTPRDIHFVDRMPMLPAGKPDLVVLEQQLARYQHEQDGPHS